MRREKTVCANFTLGTPDKAIQLKPDSGSTAVLVVPGFSEEKADTMSILAIRFASENALEFKKDGSRRRAPPTARDAPAHAAAAPEAAPAAAAGRRVSAGRSPLPCRPAPALPP